MQKWPVGLMIAGLACVGPRVQTTLPRRFAVEPPEWLLAEAEVPPPTVPNALYLGKFKTTYYWVVEEDDYPTGRSVPIYDTHGELVGRFPRGFVDAFKIEAAARLRDGRCLSYMKKADRALVGDHFLGFGGHTLVELKSVAVDPRVVPIGARLYIPQAERVVCNGRPHNGIFYAHDIGSAVQGKHIDIFAGSRGNVEAFTSAGMRSLGSVDVYILE